MQKENTGKHPAVSIITCISPTGVIEWFLIFLRVVHSLCVHALVTENPGIKPRNTNVVLNGRHSLLQHWMQGG